MVGVVCEGRDVDRLREAQVEIIRTSTCNQTDWYNGVISDKMICAGSKTGRVDTCQVTHHPTNEGGKTSRPTNWNIEINPFGCFLKSGGCFPGGQRRASAVLQWRWGPLLRGRGDQLRREVWPASQTRGVRPHQQVQHLAGKNPGRSLICTGMSPSNSCLHHAPRPDFDAALRRRTKSPTNHLARSVCAFNKYIYEYIY